MVAEHLIERVYSSTPRGEGFREFLDMIDPTVKCEKCGGLPYDIVFSYGDTLYKFCLYKIQRGDVILAETDYEKLHEYTKYGGEMMTNRAQKKRQKA